MNVLILGGTAEAVDLADLLYEKGVKVTTSLAGRTDHPHRPKGKLISGGFGGARGLAAFLSKHHINYLVDATHPFATEISGNAVAASAESGVPMVRLERPPFAEPPQARWWRVETISEAVAMLPQGASVLVTIGRQHLEPLTTRRDVQFLVRSIEAPEIDLPPTIALLQARPPFDRAGELKLMRREGITHLISKDSGGDATSAKLEAAFMLKVQVVMLNRPQLPEAPLAQSVGDVVSLIDQVPAPRSRFFFFP